MILCRFDRGIDHAARKGLRVPDAERQLPDKDFATGWPILDLTDCNASQSTSSAQNNLWWERLIRTTASSTDHPYQQEMPRCSYLRLVETVYFRVEMVKVFHKYTLRRTEVCEGSVRQCREIIFFNLEITAQNSLSETYSIASEPDITSL